MDNPFTVRLDRRDFSWLCTAMHELMDENIDLKERLDSAKTVEDCHRCLERYEELEKEYNKAKLEAEYPTMHIELGEDGVSIYSVGDRGDHRYSMKPSFVLYGDYKGLREENAKLKERAEYFKDISEAVTEGSKILSRDWMAAAKENHRLEEENAELKRKLEAWEASGGSFYPLLNEGDVISVSFDPIDHLICAGAQVQRSFVDLGVALRKLKCKSLEKLAWAVVEHDDAENEKIKVERVSDHPISLLKDYLETLKMEE